MLPLHFLIDFHFVEDDGPDKDDHEHDQPEGSGVAVPPEGGGVEVQFVPRNVRIGTGPALCQQQNQVEILDLIDETEHDEDFDL